MMEAEQQDLAFEDEVEIVGNDDENEVAVAVPTHRRITLASGVGMVFQAEIWSLDDEAVAAADMRIETARQASTEARARALSERNRSGRARSR
jgi:hypothetical protein